MSGFTREQAVKARNADLSEFLLRTDPEHYKRQGNSIRLYDPSALRKEDRIKSISIKMGASWAYDFKNEKAVNAVQYLTDYMNYSLVDAIKALAGDDVVYRQAQPNPDYAKIAAEKAKVPPEFPEKTDKQAKQMYGYLCGRGIPAETVANLAKLGLIYQSKVHNNIVFINGKKDFAELRGTYTYGEPFHGVIRNRPDRFWSFAVGRPEKAYVCEGAIDAISLYVLKQREGTENNALYVSLGGVANQQSIDLIKRRIPVILAVDNDDAGQKCRDRNPDCDSIIPSRKDWNDDLRFGPLEKSLDDVLADADGKAVSANTSREREDKAPARSGDAR